MAERAADVANCSAMLKLTDHPAAQAGGSFRRRVIFTTFVVLGMAALFAAAWALRTLLLITFLAVLLAIVLRSLGDIVHRWTGMRPHWGVLLVAAILVLLSIGAAVLLAPTIADQARQLVERLPQTMRALEERVGQFPWLRSLWEQVSSGLSLPEPGDTMGQAGRIIGAVSAALGYAGLALGGALFLALDPGLYRRGFLRLVPMRHRPFTTRLSVMYHFLGKRRRSARQLRSWLIIHQTSRLLPDSKRWNFYLQVARPGAPMLA